MKKNILITGGAGFVGSNLAVYFKNDFPNYVVTSFDNLKRRGSELNLPRLKNAGVEFVHGDVRIIDDLEQIKNANLIIDCSAEPSVLTGYDSSPMYAINTNLLGTINCLELARKNNADFIFLSTSRVYPIKNLNRIVLGETGTRFELSDKQSLLGVSKEGISEQFSLEGARSIYGTTKFTSEVLLTEYIDAYKLKGIINRCGVLTGPWQMGKVDQGFVTHWVAKHIFGGDLAYIGYGGSGKQVRDILHVKDLYDLLVMQIDNIDLHNGQIYNVGGGKECSVSLRELTDLCHNVINLNVEIDRVSETRSGDVPLYISDCRKIKSVTGWSPKYFQNEIVAEIADWMKKNKKKLSSIFS